MIALSLGCTFSASTAASAKNGRNDSLTPSRASKSALARSRSRAMAVTSASTTVVSCAEVCSDSTMRRAINCRARDIGSVVPRSLEGSTGRRDGVAGPDGLAAGAAAATAAAGAAADGAATAGAEAGGGGGAGAAAGAAGGVHACQDEAACAGTGVADCAGEGGTDGSGRAWGTVTGRGPPGPPRSGGGPVGGVPRPGNPSPAGPVAAPGA